ncbi:GIY-YIG nuclease family protein [Peribacillus frigoritolerans]|uniref:GIY-YIG nuclease family protein n=1 Tax=Peribacillus frigoritolerans TaxID=450367 RepID=UPI00227F5618|nr:GIY-YIG nuclease family protein [Peribacillus frigoritolerans]MCY9005656.1 GIY-YIG nuclease family protein [Peribacillus frigoritolerans]
MMRKSMKTLSGLKLNLWQENQTEIRLSVTNPHNGRKRIISSVEHTDLHSGEDKARTHNNLFIRFKEMLESNGKWKTDEELNSRKKRNLSSEFEPIAVDNKYGYIYITTNKINGKQYIGKHSRFDINYIGSGTELKLAIKEFGKENFENEVIAYAFSNEHLNELERSYIKIFNAVKASNFYNLAPSGEWQKR